VAKYVAISTLEASLDVASMAATSTKVFILEVMGRHAGWIAAASALASPNGSPPHIILFPEIPFEVGRFVAKVRESIDKDGYCTIVVSEGIRDKQGKFLADAGLTDAFGHTQLGGVAPVISHLVKRELSYKCHWAVADYLQRAARHIASKNDVEQAYALGRAAVEHALQGETAVMLTIERLNSSPYQWKIGSIALDQVANQERHLPRDFISEDGFHITEKCRRYLKPLIAGECYPEYESGIPRYVQLKKILAPKKVGKVDVA
jgi:6-phosphofructokinase 1